MSSNIYKNLLSYHKGLEGLSKEDRAQWEKEYADKIQGIPQAYVDEFFKANTLRQALYKSSNKTLRDIAINPNFDSLYEDETRRLSWLNELNKDTEFWNTYMEENVMRSTPYSSNPYSSSEYGDIAETMFNKGASDSRKSDIDLFKLESEKATSNSVAFYKNEAKRKLDDLTPVERDNKLKEFIQMSESISPYFKHYSSTGDFDFLQADDYAELYSQFMADNQIDQEFAVKRLQDTYQDLISERQDLLDKTGNAVAQFGIDAASTLIMAGGIIAGIANAATGNQLFEGEDQGDAWYDNILDNSITRYAADLFETQSFNVDEQQKLKDLGLSKHQILNTKEDEASLFSVNTPFELFGQYGFTVGSMLLSGGASGFIKAGTKGAFKAALAANKGLKGTQAGYKLARFLVNAKAIALKAVPTAIALPEANLEGLSTYNKVKRENSEKVRQKLMSQYVNNPIDDEELFNRTGLTREQAIEKGLINTQTHTVTEAGAYALTEHLAPELDSEIEDNAKAAYYTTFGLNALILGAVSNTLKLSMHPFSVRNQFKQNVKKLSDRVTIDQVGKNVARAVAKEPTKLNFIQTRLKEAIGEGLEEYGQSIASAYVEGVANYKTEEYLEDIYGSSDAEKLLVDDWSTYLIELSNRFAAGTKNAIKTATSKQAIKEGLYGMLSTLVGGPNINYNMSFGKRQQDESVVNFLQRNSPIAWRSIIDPVINDTERQATIKQNQQLADVLNNFLSDKAAQDRLFTAKGAINAYQRYLDAVDSKDANAIKQARMDIMMHDLIQASSLQGTVYYDALMQHLNKRANLKVENLQDENSIESLIVKEYLKDNPTDQSISAEEIINKSVKAAQQSLNYIKLINKERGRLSNEFQFDRLDTHVQNALIRAKLNTQYHEDEIKEEEDKLQQLANAPTNQTVSALPENLKRSFARYGSPTKANNAIEQRRKKLEENKAALEEEKKVRKDLENSAELDDNTKQMIKGISKKKEALLQSEIDNLKEEISELESYVKEAKDQTFDGHFLTVKDIVELDPISRQMFIGRMKTGNKNNAQKRELESLRQQLPDAYQVIENAGIHKKAYNDEMTLLTEAMMNPNAVTAWGNQIKKQAEKAYALSRYQAISALEDRDTFFEAVLREHSKIPANDVIDYGNRLDALEQAAKSNPYFGKEYEERGKQFSKLQAQIKRTSLFQDKETSDELKGQASLVLNYLFNSNINLNDLTEVIATLSEENVITNLEKTAQSLGHNISIEDLNKAANFLIQSLYELSEIKAKDAAQIAEQTRIEETVAEEKAKPTPTTISIPPPLPSSFESEGSTEESITEEESVIPANVLNTKAAAGQVRQQANPQSGRTSLFAISNLRSMSEKYPWIKAAGFNQEHLDKLEKGTHLEGLSLNNMILVFYTPKDAEESVKISMGSAYKEEEHLPVVVALKKGGELIPISILPASNNANQEGSNQTIRIRQELLKNPDNKEKGISTIDGEKIKVIKSTSSAPQHLQNTERSLRQVLTDSGYTNFELGETFRFEVQEVVTEGDKDNIFVLEEDVKNKTSKKLVLTTPGGKLKGTKNNDSTYDIYSASVADYKNPSTTGEHKSFAQTLAGTDFTPERVEYYDDSQYEQAQIAMGHNRLVEDASKELEQSFREIQGILRKLKNGDITEENARRQLEEHINLKTKQFNDNIYTSASLTVNIDKLIKDTLEEGATKVSLPIYMNGTLLVTEDNQKYFSLPITSSTSTEESAIPTNILANVGLHTILAANVFKAIYNLNKLSNLHFQIDYHKMLENGDYAKGRINDGYINISKKHLDYTWEDFIISIPHTKQDKTPVRNVVTISEDDIVESTVPTQGTNDTIVETNEGDKIDLDTGSSQTEENIGNIEDETINRIYNDLASDSNNKKLFRELAQHLRDNYGMKDINVSTLMTEYSDKQSLLDVIAAKNIARQQHKRCE